MLLFEKSKIFSTKQAFTIVELLVVIVVVGILAAITIVSYTGINSKAIAASLQSDLNGASKNLKLYYVEHGSYPTGLDASNCPTGSDPSPDPKYCFKISSGNTFEYTPAVGASPQTFILDATNTNTTKYRVTNNTAPALVIVASITCPSGFIGVPGSATYGTSNFCVMKYEAKQVGATNVPISEAANTPWTAITQANAATYSANVVGCTGCHLITEAEWLTIAQNVLGVASNWSGGSVGSGYIYSGNNDATPNTKLAADTDDNNGYFGTGESAPSNQRRTLTLSNGGVIWDMAGNVFDRTAGTCTGGQPGLVPGEASYAWKEWPTLVVPGTLSPNVFPSGTGIAGAGAWTSANGIGELYSQTGDLAIKGYLRGASYGRTIQAGVMSLYLMLDPSGTPATAGFRVAGSPN